MATDALERKKDSKKVRSKDLNIRKPAYETGDLGGSVKRLWERYRQYRDYWQKFIIDGIEAYDFHNGNQWQGFDMQRFQSKDRPMVTINIVGQLVRSVTGFRVRERLQPTVHAERDGTIQEGVVESQMLYHILKRSNYQAENERVQQDQVVTGQGWWEIYPDFEDNPLGEIKIRREDWNAILPDPMAKDSWYRDSREMFRVKFVAPEVAMDLYNLSEDQAFIAGSQFTWDTKNSRERRNRFEDFTDTAGNLLVIERWKKKVKKVKQITDGFVFRDIPKGATIDDMRKVVDGEIFQVEKRERRMEVTTIIPALDGIEPIERSDSVLQLKGNYPFVPAICYKGMEDIFGIVRDVQDEQRRLNKTYSMMIEILGHSAKGAWLTKKGSVDTEQFDQNISRPGGRIDYEGEVKPSYIQTTNFPPGLSDLIKLSEPNIRRITGITPALEGRSEFSGESGIKFAQKLQQAKEQLSIIDRRFVDAFSYVNKLILIGIPEVYNNPYSMKILEGSDTFQDLTKNQKIGMDEIQKALDTQTIDFNVSIEQVNESVSWREQKFEQMAALMAQIGPQFASLILPELVRGSNLENRGELADRIELLSGQILQSLQQNQAISGIQAQQNVQAQQANQQQQSESSAIDNQTKVAEAQMKTEKHQLDSAKTVSDIQNKEASTNAQNLEAMSRTKKNLRETP